MFATEFDLPVKVDVDLGPTNGGAWLDGEEDRERASWLDRGSITRAPFAGPFAGPLQKLPITYRIPAVVNAQDVDIAWPDADPAGGHYHGRTLAQVVEVDGDGRVSSHEWDWRDDVLLALGF